MAYGLAMYLGFEAQWCGAVALATTVLMRLGALRWHWEMPVFYNEN